MEDNKVVDVEEVKEVTENKPTLEKGNYIIQIVSEGQEIKKLAVANAEIYVQRLADGGMTVDLK